VRSADGIFGPKTYNAVIKFQKSVGLTADGIVGPNTRQALGLSGSTTGSSVSRSGSDSTRGSQTLTMVATAYCPCAKCNYPFYGKPSYLGLPLAKGIIAVDPKVSPMGTRL
jgi:peptidoglycan hydrolase-like protein with peptidoglycan-binding domain